MPVPRASESCIHPRPGSELPSCLDLRGQATRQLPKPHFRVSECVSIYKRLTNEREDAGVSSVKETKNGASLTVSVFSSSRCSSSRVLCRRRSPKYQAKLSRIESTPDPRSFAVRGVDNIVAFLIYRVPRRLFASHGGINASNWVLK
jgi:hypothetical protein